MTKQEYEQMVDRLGELHSLNSERRGMLGRLYCLGGRYPDEDLDAAYEAIKAETQRRIERTEKQIDTLEMLLEAEAVEVSA